MSSVPAELTMRVRSPRMAQSIAVAAAVPATVMRISSMKSARPPSGMAVTGRPRMSRTAKPTQETSKVVMEFSLIRNACAGRS